MIVCVPFDCNKMGKIRQKPLHRGAIFADEEIREEHYKAKSLSLETYNFNALDLITSSIIMEPSTSNEPETNESYQRRIPEILTKISSDVNDAKDNNTDDETDDEGLLQVSGFKLLNPCDVSFDGPDTEDDDDDVECLDDNVDSKHEMKEALSQFHKYSNDIVEAKNIDQLILNHCHRIFTMIERDYHKVNSSILRTLVNKMFSLLCQLKFNKQSHRNQEWVNIVAQATRLRLKLFEVKVTNSLVHITESMLIFLSSLSEQLLEVCSNDRIMCLEVLLRIPDFKRTDEIKQSNMLQKLIRFILEELTKQLVVHWRRSKEPIKFSMSPDDYLIILLAYKKIDELERKVTGKNYGNPQTVVDFFDCIPELISRYLAVTEIVDVSKFKHIMQAFCKNRRISCEEILDNFEIFAIRHNIDRENVTEILDNRLIILPSDRVSEAVKITKKFSKKFDETRTELIESFAEEQETEISEEFVEPLLLDPVRGISVTIVTTDSTSETFENSSIKLVETRTELDECLVKVQENEIRKELVKPFLDTMKVQEKEIEKQETPVQEVTSLVKVADPYCNDVRPMKRIILDRLQQNTFENIINQPMKKRRNNDLMMSESETSKKLGGSLSIDQFVSLLDFQITETSCPKRPVGTPVENVDRKKRRTSFERCTENYYNNNHSLPETKLLDELEFTIDEHKRCGPNMAIENGLDVTVNDSGRVSTSNLIESLKMTTDISIKQADLNYKCDPKLLSSDMENHTSCSSEEIEVHKEDCKTPYSKCSLSDSKSININHYQKEIKDVVNNGLLEQKTIVDSDENFNHSSVHIVNQKNQMLNMKNDVATKIGEYSGENNRFHGSQCLDRLDSKEVTAEEITNVKSDERLISKKICQEPMELNANKCFQNNLENRDYNSEVKVRSLPKETDKVLKVNSGVSLKSKKCNISRNKNNIHNSRNLNRNRNLQNKKILHNRGLSQKHNNKLLKEDHDILVVESASSPKIVKNGFEIFTEIDENLQSENGDTLHVVNTNKEENFPRMSMENNVNAKQDVQNTIDNINIINRTREENCLNVLEKIDEDPKRENTNLRDENTARLIAEENCIKTTSVQYNEMNDPKIVLFSKENNEVNTVDIVTEKTVEDRIVQDLIKSEIPRMYQTDEANLENIVLEETVKEVIVEGDLKIKQDAQIIVDDINIISMAKEETCVNELEEIDENPENESPTLDNENIVNLITGENYIKTKSVQNYETTDPGIVPFGNKHDIEDAVKDKNEVNIADVVLEQTVEDRVVEDLIKSEIPRKNLTDEANLENIVLEETVEETIVEEDLNEFEIPPRKNLTEETNLEDLVLEETVEETIVEEDLSEFEIPHRKNLNDGTNLEDSVLEETVEETIVEEDLSEFEIPHRKNLNDETNLEDTVLEETVEERIVEEDLSEFEIRPRNNLENETNLADFAREETVEQTTVEKDFNHSEIFSQNNEIGERNLEGLVLEETFVEEESVTQFTFQVDLVNKLEDETVESSDIHSQEKIEFQNREKGPQERVMEINGLDSSLEMKHPPEHLIQDLIKNNCQETQYIDKNPLSKETSKNKTKQIINNTLIKKNHEDSTFPIAPNNGPDVVIENFVVFPVVEPSTGKIEIENNIQVETEKQESVSSKNLSECRQTDNINGFEVSSFNYVISKSSRAEANDQRVDESRRFISITGNDTGSEKVTKLDGSEQDGIYDSCVNINIVNESELVLVNVNDDSSTGNSKSKVQIDEHPEEVIENPGKESSTKLIASLNVGTSIETASKPALGDNCNSKSLSPRVKAKNILNRTSFEATSQIDVLDSNMHSKIENLGRKEYESVVAKNIDFDVQNLRTNSLNILHYNCEDGFQNIASMNNENEPGEIEFYKQRLENKLVPQKPSSEIVETSNDDVFQMLDEYMIYRSDTLDFCDFYSGSSSQIQLESNDSASGIRPQTTKKNTAFDNIRLLSDVSDTFSLDSLPTTPTDIDNTILVSGKNSKANKLSSEAISLETSRSLEDKSIEIIIEILRKDFEQLNISSPIFEQNEDGNEESYESNLKTNTQRQPREVVAENNNPSLKSPEVKSLEVNTLDEKTQNKEQTIAEMTEISFSNDVSLVFDTTQNVANIAAELLQTPKPSSPITGSNEDNYHEDNYDSTFDKKFNEVVKKLESRKMKKKKIRKPKSRTRSHSERSSSIESNPIRFKNHADAPITEYQTHAISEFTEELQFKSNILNLNLEDPSLVGINASLIEQIQNETAILREDLLKNGSRNLEKLLTNDKNAPKIEHQIKPIIKRGSKKSETNGLKKSKPDQNGKTNNIEKPLGRKSNGKKSTPDGGYVEYRLTRQNVKKIIKWGLNVHVDGDGILVTDPEKEAVDNEDTRVGKPSDISSLPFSQTSPSNSLETDEFDSGIEDKHKHTSLSPNSMCDGNVLDYDCSNEFCMPTSFPSFGEDYAKYFDTESSASNVKDPVLSSTSSRSSILNSIL